MKKRIGFILVIILAIVTFLLTSLLSINTAEQMSGVSRVVNYAGIVRGATQRLVKLELSGIQNDKLITYLNDILNDLRFDTLQEYNLKTLDSKDYNDKLTVLNDKWVELKQVILIIRLTNDESANALRISEEHFFIANETVGLAESYGEGLADKLNYIKQILLATIIALFSATIFIVFNIIKLKKEAKILELASNIDFATGLPNKSKCEQLFADYGILDPNIKYTMIMFDLNNLKSVNDSLGHQFGDELINSFANILKTNAPQNVFTGRFGGDEFIVIFHHTNEDTINSYIDVIKMQVKSFNCSQENACFTISFAVGYSWTHGVKDVTMQTLFIRADADMYSNKRADKDLILKQSAESFSCANHDKVKNLVYNLTGISLLENKDVMISERLYKIQQDTKFGGDLDELLDKIEKGEYVNEFINSFTTNKTHFFGEEFHFDDLKNRVIPEFLAKNGSSASFQLYCSASSTGEEPYSMAMTIKEAEAENRQTINAKIITTDIDTSVLQYAANGVYRYAKNSKEFPSWIQPQKYFKKRVVEDYGNQEIILKIKDELKNMITFQQMNLNNDTYPFSNNQFDVIFCRNILIYFSAENQNNMLKKLFKHLKVGGTLYIGHSENPHDLISYVQKVGQNTFVKVKEI